MSVHAINTNINTNTKRKCLSRLSEKSPRTVATDATTTAQHVLSIKVPSFTVSESRGHSSSLSRTQQLRQSLISEPSSGYNSDTSRESPLSTFLTVSRDSDDFGSSGSFASSLNSQISDRFSPFCFNHEFVSNSTVPVVKPSTTATPSIRNKILPMSPLQSVSMQRAKEDDARRRPESVTSMLSHDMRLHWNLGSAPSSPSSISRDELTSQPIIMQQEMFSPFSKKDISARKLSSPQMQIKKRCHFGSSDNNTIFSSQKQQDFTNGGPCKKEHQSDQFRGGSRSSSVLGIREHLEVDLGDDEKEYSPTSPPNLMFDEESLKLLTDKLPCPVALFDTSAPEKKEMMQGDVEAVNAAPTRRALRRTVSQPAAVSTPIAQSSGQDSWFSTECKRQKPLACNIFSTPPGANHKWGSFCSWNDHCLSNDSRKDWGVSAAASCKDLELFRKQFSNSMQNTRDKGSCDLFFSPTEMLHQGQAMLKSKKQIVNVNPMEIYASPSSSFRSHDQKKTVVL